MPLNWLFEALKWKESIRSQIQLKPMEAFKAVFQGISLGIITPGRVGEYGGRILYIDPKHRISGVLGTLVCSLYQNIINILIASIFLTFTSLSFIEHFNKFTYLTFGILLSIIVLIFILKLPFFIAKLFRIPFLAKRIKDADALINQLKNTHQLRIFLFAFLRYIVYCLQYFLLFQIFKISLSPSETFIAIGIIYGIQTILPLTPLLQIGIRGSIALLVISPLATEESMVILASYSLWLINLLVPSILGGVLMLLRRTK